MFRQNALATALLLLATAALVQHATAIDVTRNKSLIANLIQANSQLDRLALLPTNNDWLFDFTIQDKYTFAPGGVINMNSATFPAAKGNGMTLALLNLGGCSMLPPHLHPRASNYVIATKGNTTTYMFEENGARLVTEVLTPGLGTIFPKGSMHMMVNNDCEDAQLVSALNSDDTGTMNIGQVFTNGFPADLVNAAFGSNLASPQTAENMVPVGTGSNWGTAACLARCGIKRDTD